MVRAQGGGLTRPGPWTDLGPLVIYRPAAILMSPAKKF